ncbi:hypothetical protein EV363DRAFT_1198381 [Boletus edulis]|nr:hypothetical protein EV363DRAFT_1198381 [Boletus edulis]
MTSKPKASSTKVLSQNETPTDQHTNTLLIWGGCPRELLTSQAMSGIEFPILHVVRHLRDKWKG